MLRLFYEQPLEYNPNLGTIHGACFGGCGKRTPHFWVSNVDGDRYGEVSVCVFCGTGTNGQHFEIPHALQEYAGHQLKQYQQLDLNFQPVNPQ